MAERLRTDGEPASSSMARFSSSGWLTPLLIAVVCVIVLSISYEAGKGNYHKLHDRLLASAHPQPAANPTNGPGGEDPITLHREPDATGRTPEFVSVTLLPGRGMNLLQMTAMIPGHGEVPLMVSPPVEQLGGLLTGTGADANGALSTTMGGAFLVPWAGRATGKPGPTADSLQTSYGGVHLTFPAAAPGGFTSTEGLLLNRAADSTTPNALLDGQTIEGVFHTGSFSGNWPSTADVKVSVEMSGHLLDMTVTVQNTGLTDMPAAVGWKPHFAIPSGDRKNALLTVSAADRLELDRATGLPNGRVTPVMGGPADFNHAHGTRLGGTSVDETFVHLSTPALAQNPMAELRDPAWGFGLRVMPMTANIREFRVEAPADKPWVSLGPNTNAGDPFGPQWTSESPSGMQTLKPGESLTWKVRVELFSFVPGDHGPSL